MRRRFSGSSISSIPTPTCSSTCRAPRRPMRSPPATRRGHRGATPVSITARFLIDATGAGGFLPRSLGLTDDVSSLRTRSRALYSHFIGVEPWHDRLAAIGGRVADHPFCCDDAAQHHVLDGAWMWMLRFNNGVTSAGLTIDDRRHPYDPSVTPEHEWDSWLDRYPSLARLFRHATVASHARRPLSHRRSATPRERHRWATLGVAAAHGRSCRPPSQHGDCAHTVRHRAAHVYRGTLVGRRACGRR